MKSFLTTALTAAALSLGSTSQTRADHFILPPGTSVAELEPSGTIANTLRASGAQVIDIIPDHFLSLSMNPALRLSLIKSDTSHTVPISPGGTPQAYSLGNPVQTYVRFNFTAGKAEVSPNLGTWEWLENVGTALGMSRDDVETLGHTATQLSEIAALAAEQQRLQWEKDTLQASLTAQQVTLTALTTDLSSTEAALIASQNSLSTNTTTQRHLSTTIQPEATLRENVHPVALNTSSDATKNTGIQTALATYDSQVASTLSLTNIRGTSGLAGIPMIATKSLLAAPIAPMATYTPPTLTSVESTISVLQSELSRLVTQIAEKNTEIANKQVEINTHEALIIDYQTDIDDLQRQINTQTTIYNNETNNYNYWSSEVSRLGALENTASAQTNTALSNYTSDRNRLITAGRSDVPSNIDAPNILTQIDTLINTITNEYNSLIPVVNNSGTATAATIPDETSTVRTTLDGYSQYYYVVDYPASGNRWPAVLKAYMKMQGESSYSLISSVNVYNSTHSVNMFNNYQKGRIEKRSQQYFATNVLKPDASSYVNAKSNYNTYNSQKNTAITNRDTALSKRNTANSEINRLATEKSFFVDLQNISKDARTAAVTSKAQLEALKNTKAQLQTLYTRVDTLIKNLKNHVISYQSVSAEVTMLLVQINTLQAEVNNLSFSVATTQSIVNTLTTEMANVDSTLNVAQNTLNQSRSALIDQLSRIEGVLPRDHIVPLSASGGVALTFDQVRQYFSYGYRTSSGNTNISLSDGSTLPVRAIVEYLDTFSVEDIYPAKLRYDFTINGISYSTEPTSINNLEHKGVMADIIRNALKLMQEAINAKNEASDINQGMKTAWDKVKATLGQINTANNQFSGETNAQILAFNTTKNTLTKNIILTGVAQAFFDHLATHEASFATLFDDCMTTLATQQNSMLGSDEYSDTRRIMLHTLAKEFSTQLAAQNFAGINTYTDYRVTAESFMASKRNSLIANPDIVDINDAWITDTHGNKYKFGIHAVNGNNTFPQELWMTYSPDGRNTLTLGPVTLSSANEVTSQKERWRKELENMKQGDTVNYNGGSYTLFRGWGEDGVERWWGRYLLSNNILIHSTDSFSNLTELEKNLKKEINLLNRLNTEMTFFTGESNLSADLITQIQNSGETVAHFIENHDGTEKFLAIIQKLKDELVLGEVFDFQDLVGGGRIADIKTNADFEDISFIDPETNESSVFINGYVLSRSQLGNFLVGFGGGEIGFSIGLVQTGALIKQKKIYLENKVKYGFGNLNTDHINQLAIINENEDIYMYIAGHRYNTLNDLNELNSILSICRKLSLQQAINDKNERDRIIALNDN